MGICCALHPSAKAVGCWLLLLKKFTTLLKINLFNNLFGSPLASSNRGYSSWAAITHHINRQHRNQIRWEHTRFSCNVMSIAELSQHTHSLMTASLVCFSSLSILSKGGEFPLHLRFLWKNSEEWEQTRSETQNEITSTECCVCIIHLFQRHPWELPAPNKSAPSAQTGSPKEQERNVMDTGEDEGGLLAWLHRHTCMWCTIWAALSQKSSNFKLELHLTKDK